MKYNNLLLTLVLATALGIGLISCDSLQDPGYNNSKTGLSADTDNLVHKKEVISTDDYPARPAPGTLFWGAAIGGNGDPVERHEDPSGETLSIRRTFFHWRHRTQWMINIASDDLENGRLPWVSVKPPPCPDGADRCETWDWAGMGDGIYDDEIDEMLNALAALSGPVWLTVHHEPEGGGEQTQPNDTVGGIQAHIDMNRRVRERITALGLEDDIALGLILMSWTWDSRSERNPDDWWEAGIYDFLGVDHYRESEGSLLKNGEPTAVWPRIRTWAASRDVDVAVGEWGMRGTDEAAGQRVLEWYEHAVNSHDDGEGARVVALSAFDSGLNAPTGSWELKGEQLAMFQQLMGDPRTANIDDPSSAQYEITAVASGNSLADYPAENAIDSNTDTRWSSWNVLEHAWIRFDLGEPKKVDEVRLMLYKADIRGSFPLSFEAGNDPGSLTEVWSGNSTQATDFQSVSFTPVTARYIQVTMTAPHPGDYNKNLLSLWEAQIWSSIP